jgi:hypothetical protein
MNYYTYAYLREDATPYYIGKGKGRRIYVKRKGGINAPKDKSRIIFLKQNLTEEEAFRHEKYMIVVFGRIDLGTGILYNRTDGGDGCSGFTHSPETREKQSAIKKGKIFSPEHRKKISDSLKGKRHSLESRAKMSAAKKGKIPSLEHRAKLSKANSGKNNPMYGRTHSLESIAKNRAANSIANSGKNNPMYGKTHSPKTRIKLGEANKGKIWINDGNSNRRIFPNDIIPEGFRKGRTPTKLEQEHLKSGALCSIMTL